MAETLTNQYLTFTLDGEHYAAEVSQVLEILEVPKLTRLPKMPDYMKGVINIRGSVVAIVDLRRKFGLEEAPYTVDTSIIVLTIEKESASITVGCLADSVQEVVDILPENIEPVPSVGTRVNADFIRGIANNNGHFVIILDINRVFRDADLKEVQNAQADKPDAT